MIRAVLDTNNLVSAFIKPEGAQHQIIKRAVQREFLLILSPAILEELNKVLRYPRIQKKYHYTNDQIATYIASLGSMAEITAGILKIKAVQEDPKDDMVIASAKEGKANYVVSGDEHLKNLREYHGIKIVSSKEFKKILDSLL